MWCNCNLRYSSSPVSKWVQFINPYHFTTQVRHTISYLRIVKYSRHWDQEYLVSGRQAVYCDRLICTIVVSVSLHGDCRLELLQLAVYVLDKRHLSDRGNGDPF